MVQYESLEDYRAFWVIVERNYDPTESIFKTITKIIKRYGKISQKSENELSVLLNSKLSSEVTYEEFE
jgi:hypothetical protein